MCRPWFIVFNRLAEHAMNSSPPTTVDPKRNYWRSEQKRLFDLD
jgi:hypothetical protein